MSRIVLERRGLVFSPNGRLPWARTHAMLPTPLWRLDGTLRLYIGCCDVGMIGRIGYVDVDPIDPLRVLRFSQVPVLDIGEPGAFDEHGVNPCALVADGDRLLLFYNGFQRRGDMPYTLFLGLAISFDGGETFVRYSADPILRPTPEERYFRTACALARRPDGWRMWYIGGGDWVTIGGQQKPRYSLRELRSADLLDWTAPSRELIRPEEPEEFGFGRPFFQSTAKGLRLWFSARSAIGYRLSIANSADGLKWTRHDRSLSFAGPELAWDREMACYPAHVSNGSQDLLFYCGNGFGRDGVGLATVIEAT